MSCAICESRKEKRFCLAVHGRICPQCCGEQREVTLDCPSECLYLQQARQHERPRSLEDIPADELFPAIELPKHFIHDHEALVVGITHAIAQASYGDRSLNDQEVIRALVALVKSYQTLVGSGLVYQEATANIGQQALIEALRTRIAEYRELEVQHLGYSRLKDGDVIFGLVFVLRLVHSHTSGRPRSRAVLDFARSQVPSAQSAAGDLAQQSGSGLILP